MNKINFYLDNFKFIILKIFIILNLRYDRFVFIYLTILIKL